MRRLFGSAMSRRGVWLDRRVVVGAALGRRRLARRLWARQLWARRLRAHRLRAHQLWARQLRGGASPGLPNSGVPVPGGSAPGGAAPSVQNSGALNASAPIPGVSPSPSASAGADPFTVRGVEVDVTETSAAAARDQAILQAQRKAYQILFKKMTVGGENAQPPVMKDLDLARMVEGFEIEQERASAIRYVASFTVKFRPKVAQSYFSRAGARVAEAPRKPMLILPIAVGESGRPALWEERTSWRSAWEERAVGGGGVSVIVPPGDLADVADIGVAEAQSGAADRMSKIAARYGAGDVVVAVLGNSPVGGGSLPVTLTRYTPDGRSESKTVSVTVAPGDPAGKTLQQAIATAVSSLESSFRVREEGPETPYLIGVGYGKLDEWLDIRRRLAQVTGLTRAELLSVSRNRAEMEVRFRGDVERFRQGLARQDLGMEPTSPIGVVSSSAPARAGSWELRILSRGVQSSAPAPLGGGLPPSVSSPGASAVPDGGGSLSAFSGVR
ncbi:conserved hypothetical protein [Azospirillaceae bacterium]